jgi:hypothetical protein
MEDQGERVADEIDDNLGDQQASTPEPPRQ